MSPRLERWLNWGVLVGLFVLALVPRLLGRLPLNNPDELLWINRTLGFWAALDQGDLAGTYQRYHPGVVPMWAFGAATWLRYAGGEGMRHLFELQAADSLPMLTLAQTMALAPVLLTSLTVVVGYRWLGRLTGWRVAWLAALLLALEPYYLTHSSFVHLDATLTSLMYLAVLAWLVYLLAGGGRHYLVLSSVLAGLAVLTKMQAVYLVPFAALAAGVTYLARVGGLWNTRSRHEVGRLATSLGIWLLLVGLTVFVAWPALWVDAAGVLANMTGFVSEHLQNPHVQPTFFMGRPVDDPGVLYYVLTLAFRLRPLTFVFAPLGLFLLLAWRRLSVQQRALLALGIAYPVFFFVQMSLGSQKMERYLLPMVPALVVLAAVMLVASVNWVTRGRAVRTALAFLSALVFLGSLAWLRLAPHYSTYFNPLLGGGPRAVELFTVGGGEGLDLAADYLNAKAGAEDLWALSFYPQVFKPYFVGHSQSLRYGSWSGLPVAADYVVITSAQVQRGLYPTTLDFFLPRQPEYTARINGIDYAWVYRVPRQELATAPPMDAWIDANFEHQVHLLGYSLAHGPGHLQVTLYWQLIVSLDQEHRVRLWLTDTSGRVLTEQLDPPWSGDVTVLSWSGYLAVRDVHTLPLPVDLPPGDLSLHLELSQRASDGTVRWLELEGGGGTAVQLPVIRP